MRWAFLSLAFISLFFSSLFLSGCGASSSNADSSRGTVSSASSYISPTAALAECNNISGSEMVLSGQVSTYYQAGQLVPSDLLLNLASVPPTVESSNTAYLQFVPYYEPTPGNISYGSALSMVFMDKLTGATSNQYSEISLANIQSALKDLALTSTITPSQFFSRVYVLLVGVAQQYVAASAELFDSSKGSGALSSLNFLLPIFYANPSVYQVYEPSPDLDQLHPFWSYLSSGYSDSEFASMDEQICQAMSGGGRIPASVGAMDQVDMVSMANNLKGFLHTPLGARLVHVNFFARIWTQFLVSYLQPTWRQIIHSILDLNL